MSVQADIYVAPDDAEAVRYASEPAMFKDRQQYASFTVLELSTLWAKMRGMEWMWDCFKVFPQCLSRMGAKNRSAACPQLWLPS